MSYETKSSTTSGSILVKWLNGMMKTEKWMDALDDPSEVILDTWVEAGKDTHKRSKIGTSLSSAWNTQAPNIGMTQSFTYYIVCLWFAFPTRM